MDVDTSTCTIESSMIPHDGEPKLSYYRDHNKSVHVQVLCKAHRGNHWEVVGDSDKVFAGSPKKSN
jgi:hypothetical protein